MSRATRRALAAGLAATTAVAGTAGAAPAAGWRDGGRITGAHDTVLMDGSGSEVVVAVGTTGPSYDRPRARSTFARRSADGTWTRFRARVGEPVGVHVDPRGGAVVVSVREQQVLATVWRRGAAQGRTRVLLRAADAPADYFSTDSVSNGRGDVAVLLTAWPGHGDRAVLVRKPAGERWRRPLTIAPTRYDGVLHSVDLAARGAVVGAFTRDHDLSLRRLHPHRDAFGAPRAVTTWPAVDDGTRPHRRSVADVEVGRDGDLAVTWAYAESRGSSELVHTRLVALPTRGRRWSRDFEHADDALRLLAVAHDGAVLVQDGLRARRWNPVTRRLQGRGTWFLKDANVRGDALVGSGHYGGKLRLWPVGAARGPEVPAPAGTLGPVVLTASRTAYAAVVPEGGRGFHLRLRRF